ncbi:MAG: lipid A-modifier LpxR family protein, partial [Crocinitomicaceae bacterium]
MKKILIFIFLLFIQAKVNAQRIDNTSSLFQIEDSTYGRISYDNDLFQAKDIYYTQGITLDIYAAGLRKNPINYALLHFRNSVRSNYSIQLASTVYTPTSILSDSILKGDRPFSAVLTVGFIQSTIQRNAKRMLTTQLDLGVIGPTAL